MRVAICFYGQPRFYKQVLPIWQKVIKELEADVFIHTWYGQDRASSITNIDELISDLNPKEIKISQPHRLLDLVSEDCKFENESFHGMQQAYTISNSVNLLYEYELNNNTQYDIIIRCRMDIELHNADLFVEFIKNEIKNDKLYVCENHWPNGIMFDDNIMIGTGSTIKDIFLQYFAYTIAIINHTKIIPGGEQNIFRYLAYKNLLENIIKTNALNFNLLYIPVEQLILNQND
jgi:hypothetical protein